MSSLRQDLEAEDATKQATALLQVCWHLQQLCGLQGSTGLAAWATVVLRPSGMYAICGKDDVSLWPSKLTSLLALQGLLLVRRCHRLAVSGSQ